MILIIDCGSSKTPEIKHKLEQLNDSCEVKTIDNIPKDLSKYKGVIISGAPILLTEKKTEDYLSKFEFLSTVSIPILGICFGHQIIGLYFGGEISRCREERTNIKITLHSSPIFKNLNKFSIFSEDHCEMVSLPTDFSRIAYSNYCKNEAMQHNKKLIFGVQFHPETSNKNGFILFSNFLKMCNE